jgi:hypothetical protein
MTNIFIDISILTIIIDLNLLHELLHFLEFLKSLDEQG